MYYVRHRPLTQGPLSRKNLGQLNPEMNAMPNLERPAPCRLSQQRQEAEAHVLGRRNAAAPGQYPRLDGRSPTSMPACSPPITTSATSRTSSIATSAGNTAWSSPRRQTTSVTAAIDGGQPARRTFGGNVTYTDWSKDNYFTRRQGPDHGRQAHRHRVRPRQPRFPQGSCRTPCPGVEFVDVAAPSMRMRMIKSAEEIKHITKMARSPILAARPASRPSPWACPSMRWRSIRRRPWCAKSPGSGPMPN